MREEPGGLWAKRSHSEPIANESHFSRVIWYVLDHENRGAAIWENDLK